MCLKHATTWKRRRIPPILKIILASASCCLCKPIHETYHKYDLHRITNVQETEDRKRIAHLLALTQPVEQEITYFRGAKPDKMTVFPRATAGPAVPHPAKPSSPGKRQHVGSPERVMRTVYLPSANTDAMMLKIESLQVPTSTYSLLSAARILQPIGVWMKTASMFLIYLNSPSLNCPPLNQAQLNEQRQFSNERITALLADRRIREQDEEAGRVAYNQRIDAQAAKLRRTEETLLATTKDLIVLRREKQEAQSRAVAADAALVQERRRMTETISDTKREAAERIEQVRRTLSFD